MARMRDMTGMHFGRLTVLDRASESYPYKWRCRCSCGNEVVVKGCNLRSGHTQSCGCLMRERTKETSITHGETGTRMYRIWSAMKRRCMNSHLENYAKYGGRGIRLWSGWMEYEPFREWALSNGYADDLTIDRIDVNGDYTPDNCRWATYKQQANNTRQNRFISFCGEVYTLLEWAELLGIHKNTLFNRLKNSKSIEDAFMNPVRHVRRKSKRMEELNG